MWIRTTEMFSSLKLLYNQSASALERETYSERALSKIKHMQRPKSEAMYYYI